MSVAIKPAATLILVKDGINGPEILMQQRNPEAAFVGGAWVFPGGKLDAEDYHPDWLNHCDINVFQANEILQVDENGPAFWIAAIRETIEEAGILLAQQANEEIANNTQEYLQKNPENFLGYCQQNQLHLHTSRIKYLSRWITPEGNPKRYDTRFFLAAWPEGQPPRQDDHEAINTVWVTPKQALERHENDEWMLIFPTIMTLRQLCDYTSSESILDNLGQAAV